MNRSGAVWLGGLWLWLAGCAGGSVSGTKCQGDAECEGGQVCFTTGCADPSTQVVVEVVPNAKEGMFAQDFLLEELRDELELKLDDGPSTTLQGQVRVKGPPALPSPDTVLLQLTGTSLLLPGIDRKQETSVKLDEQGRYSLAVASGRYTVTLMPPGSTQLPPLSVKKDIPPGRLTQLDFLLPAPSELVELSSQLLHHDGLPLSLAEPVDVQLVDEEQTPLTQRVSVSALGRFSLKVRREDVARGRFLLVFSGTPLMPQSFRLEPRNTELPAAFLVPDLGGPVHVNGKVLDPKGRPLPNAAIYVSGRVVGGGLYRSRTAVISGLDGSFYFTTPAGFSEQGSAPTLRLSIIPPIGVLAGSTEVDIPVPEVSVLILKDVVCQERREVEGIVTSPIGEAPASGVQVEAHLVKELANTPKPASGRVVTPRRTDKTGAFSLLLDPGVYRFEFSSQENLPRFNRLVTVWPWLQTSPPQPQDLSTLLPRGRRVKGSVRLDRADTGPMPAPNASLRFYQARPVDGIPFSLLLGETTTDASGAFTTTLSLP
ncbi:MAG: hypothetical protein ABW123_07245 [Cystobacter sp.]